MRGGCAIRSKSTYAEETFEQVRLEQTDVVSAEFRECRFVRCDFSESMLRACVFDECVFAECDRSMVKLPHSVFSSTRFEDAKIIGSKPTKRPQLQDRPRGEHAQGRPLLASGGHVTSLGP